MAIYGASSNAGATVTFTAPANCTVFGVHVSFVAGAAGAVTATPKMAITAGGAKTFRGIAVSPVGAGIVSNGYSWYFPMGVPLAAGDTIVGSAVNQADTQLASAVTDIVVDYK